MVLDATNVVASLEKPVQNISVSGIKEAALKSWRDNGFYFLGKKMNRVLISSSLEKTYVFKVLFLHTGAYVIQGLASPVSKAVNSLPLTFRNMPSLSLCINEELHNSIINYIQQRGLSFSQILSSIFNMRLRAPKEQNLYSSYSNYLNIPSSLKCLFGFIDSYVKNLVNYNRGLYSDLISKGIRDSALLSSKNFKNSSETRKDHTKLVSAFVEDYVRNLKKNKWRSILATYVYKSFLIWTSKLPSWDASSILSLPSKKKFFDIILSLPDVKPSLCDGYDILNFNPESVEDVKVSEMENPSTLLEACKVQADEIVEEAKTQSDKQKHPSFTGVVDLITSEIMNDPKISNRVSNFTVRSIILRTEEILQKRGRKKEFERSNK